MNINSTFAAMLEELCCGRDSWVYMAGGGFDDAWALLASNPIYVVIFAMGCYNVKSPINCFLFFPFPHLSLLELSCHSCHHLSLLVLVPS
jgi:hypothetical protein